MVRHTLFAVVILAAAGTLFFSTALTSWVYATTFYVRCAGEATTHEKVFCYNYVFQPLVRAHGEALGFKTLDALQYLDREVGVDCHYVGHGIGKALFEYDPLNWRERFVRLPSVCRQGVVHGLLEAYLDTQPADTKETFLSICDGVEMVDGYCFHLIGHLILADTNGNVDEALSMCDWLQNDQRRHMCYAGVFMENELAQLLVAEGIFDMEAQDWEARLPEFKALCAAYDGEKSVACWLELGLVFIDLYDADMHAIYAACSDSPSEWGKVECWKYALEIVTGSLNKDNDPERLRALCAPTQEGAERAECYGYVSLFRIISSPDRFDEVVRFCSELSADPYQRECFAALGIFYDLYKTQTPFSPSEWSALCKTVPERWQDECRERRGFTLRFPHFRVMGNRVKTDFVWNGSGWAVASSSNYGDLYRLPY